MISVSVVNPLMREHGWTFEAEEGVVADPVFQAHYMHEIYTAADPKYTGRVTIPVLWDKQDNRCVSNEFSEIIRMLSSAFDGVGAKAGDYYPVALRAELDSLNDQVYDHVNNGVYKAGFATTQHAYEQAVFPLFQTLEELEQRLSKQRYLLGDQITEVTSPSRIATTPSACNGVSSEPGMMTRLRRTRVVRVILTAIWRLSPLCVTSLGGSHPILEWQTRKTRDAKAFKAANECGWATPLPYLPNALRNQLE